MNELVIIETAITNFLKVPSMKCKWDYEEMSKNSLLQ